MFFVFVCFSSRNYTHYCLAFSKTMANHEHLYFKAQPKQNKPIFIIRMVRIVELDCILVIKDGAGFFERHAMLFYICFSFALIP